MLLHYLEFHYKDPVRLLYLMLTLPRGLYHLLSFLVDYFLACFVIYSSEHMFNCALLFFAMFLKLLGS